MMQIKLDIWSIAFSPLTLLESYVYLGVDREHPAQLPEGATPYMWVSGVSGRIQNSFLWA